MPTIPFLITTLILTIIPGPGVVYTVSTALNKGRSASVIAIIGCSLGILPHLSLGIMAIAMLQQLPEVVFTAIKYIGTAYLIYMGYGMIRQNHDLTNDAHKDSTDTNTSIILKGILLNLLNPKLTLFFISFLPQYISTDGINPIYQAIILGSFSIIFTIPVFLLYGFLADAMNRKLLASPKNLTWMNRVLGSLFILFAFNLLL